MIPKIIHYCWFGGKPLPKLAEKCLASWKKYCPDYEIKRWDESNFDVHCNKYVEQAYYAKKWAFVSDYARLCALVNEGGIYLDTDVELLKTLNPYLCCSAFLGFENKSSVATCIIGLETGFTVFNDFLLSYDNKNFIKPDGSFDTTTNVKLISDYLSRFNISFDNNYQVINGIQIFPNDYFCPKDSNTKRTIITNNTVCIHHFDGSWLSPYQRFIAWLTMILGPSAIEKMVKIKHLIIK